MEIITTILDDNQVRVTDVKDVLTIQELPEEYYEHVPYMHWTDPSMKQHLFINWVGGLSHIYKGQIYSSKEWERIKVYIEQCERKLHIINHRQNVDCPFCGRSDYGKPGLIIHLEYSCKG